MRALLILVIMITLIGCSEKTTSQVYPMISTSEQVQFTLVDYQNNPIQYLYNKLDDGVVIKLVEPVYVSQNSELLTRTHGHLSDDEGFYLYWASDGSFINTNYETVVKSRFFVVGEKQKALDDRPLMVRELWLKSGRIL